TSSTIGSNTLPWAQLVTGKFTFQTGQNLVSQFQTVYKRENIVGQGVNFGNGTFTLNTTTYFTSGLSVNRNVNTRNGSALGGGNSLLSYGVLVGDSVIVGYGVLLYVDDVFGVCG